MISEVICLEEGQECPGRAPRPLCRGWHYTPINTPWKGYLSSESLILKLRASRKRMTGKQRNEISKAGEEQCVDEGHN